MEDLREWLLRLNYTSKGALINGALTGSENLLRSTTALKKFLLGVGQPLEPDPWNLYYNDPEEVHFIAGSQQIEPTITQASNSTNVSTGSTTTEQLWVQV